MQAQYAQHVGVVVDSVHVAAYAEWADEAAD